jgi:hypothetical protein
MIENIKHNFKNFNKKSGNNSYYKFIYKQNYR